MRRKIFLHSLFILVCSFIPASPRAANGQRPLAAQASVASVGAALCLKIHFFFHVNSLRRDNFWSRLGTKKSPCYIEAAQNFFGKFIEAWQFLIEIGGKKITLLYWGSPKFFVPFCSFLSLFVIFCLFLPLSVFLSKSRVYTLEKYTNLNWFFWIIKSFQIVPIFYLHFT